MSIMNAVQGGTRRTGRGAGRAWVIASLIAMGGVLTGCSASSETSSSEMYVDEAGADAAYEEEYAVDDSVETDGSTTSTADRSVIVTGSLYMTVEDPVSVADQVTVIVTGTGGRIDARSETAADEYDGGSAWLTLRIPSDDLDAVVEKFRDLGEVNEYSTESYDVTTEVTDLDARISTLRASTDRIEGLLSEAEKIADIITLETELASRQAELESLEAQQRGLEDQVSMSTIYLSLTTEPIVIIEEDSPDSFWDGLVAGWEGLVAFFSVALVVFGVLLPWLALAALITAGVVLALRARKARRARLAPAAVPAAAASEATSSHGPTDPYVTEEPPASPGSPQSN